MNAYQFARLNLTATYENKSEYLLSGFRAHKTVSVRGSKWDFYEVEEMSNEEGEYLTGYLIKYIPTVSFEVIDEGTQLLAEEKVENYIRARSQFFLHVETGALAYQTIANEIPAETFRERFAQVFEASKAEFFMSAEVLSINEEKGVYSLLQRATKITRISTYVHPSNPNLNPVWRDFEEDMKRRNITSRKEVIESGKPAGIDIVGATDIETRITMAEDGYGEADADVEIDGEKRRISSYERPVTATAPKGAVDKPTILEALRNTFRTIQSRFR